jgi:RNA polymerase sigma factor (sigma-70 family)
MSISLGHEAAGGVGPDPDRHLPSEAARKRAAVELVRNSDRELRNTARRYSLCAEDADDAYQRGIEILLSKAPTTDPRQLLPWSRTVIKHEALAIRRTRERVLNQPIPVTRDEDVEDWVQLIPWQGDGPDDHAVQRERVARSREALALLKPQELKALTQLAEGYSYAEIASLNDWTRTKVNRCLAEGRARFRSAFRESEAGERCSKLEPLISASCDGELEGPELEALRNHLDACGSCRATLRAYRAAPKAAAALLPAAPVSHSLWEKLQEAAISIQLRIQGIGGRDPDGSIASVAASGGAREAGAAAMGKLAAVCLGTAGGAAACVAVGVLPGPQLGDRGQEKPAVIERPARQVAEREAPVFDAPPVPAPASPAPDPAPQPGPDPTQPSGAGSAPADPAPAPPAPVPPTTPVEAEFTPEAAGTPVAAPPPPPAPAASSSGSSGGSGGSSSSVPLGGGGGEFGP